MADNKDQARPLQERIAALFGSGSYFDPRDGAGGTGPSSIKHQDVAAALGYVANKKGRISALVLETHYGSTLIHERELSKAWEAFCNVERFRDREVTVLTRFGGALAIRQFAGGIRYSSTQYAEYAYLIFSRREALQHQVDSATLWLRQVHDDALSEFRRVLREHATEREEKRLVKAA